MASLPVSHGLYDLNNKNFCFSYFRIDFVLVVADVCNVGTSRKSAFFLIVIELFKEVVPSLFQGISFLA